MIEIIEAIEVISLSVVMALIYGITAYVKTNTNEDLDMTKLASTLVVSVFVAAVLILTGSSITQTNIEVQLATYGILTVVVENLLKSANRKLLPKLRQMY